MSYDDDNDDDDDDDVSAIAVMRLQMKHVVQTTASSSRSLYHIGHPKIFAHCTVLPWVYLYQSHKYNPSRPHDF